MQNGRNLIEEAPYDLLAMPVGAMPLGYVKYRFSLLHQATFGNNLYTNAHLELSGGGIFLKDIPLIGILKLQDMVSFKAHYRKLDDIIIDLPYIYNNQLSYPYMELGFGYSFSLILTQQKTISLFHGFIKK